MKVNSSEDVIRVMRIIIYEGDRTWVETTLGRSLKDGTKFINPGDSTSVNRITVKTINEFAEIVTQHENLNP